MTSKAEIRLGAVDETQGPFDSVKRRLRGLSEEAKGVGDSFGATAGRIAPIAAAIAAGLAALAIKDKIDLADQIGDLSEQTGIAVERLSELRYAGQQNGAEFETLGKGIQKLGLNIAEAGEGSKSQVAVFKALGVEFKNLDGTLRGADKVLVDVADRFAGLNDGPEKAALAVELFGKEGVKLIPLLNQGSEGIAQFSAEAEALGVVFSGDLAGAAGDLNDNLDKMMSKLEGVQIQLASELLPTLALLAEEAAGTDLSGIGETIGAGLRVAVETVTILGANVTFVVERIYKDIEGVAAQFVALAKLDIDGFTAIQDAVKEDAAAARAELDAFEARVLGLARLGDGRRDAASDPRSLGVAGSIRSQEREGIQLERAAATAALTAARRAQAQAEEASRKASQAAAKAQQELNRELEAQRKLVIELNGLSGNFAEEWDRLNAVFRAGKISVEQLTLAQADLLNKQPAIRKAAEEEARARELAADRALRELAAYEEAERIADERLQAADQMVKSIEFETAALGMSNLEREVAIELLRLEEQGLKRGSVAYEDYADKIRKAVTDRNRAQGAVDLAKQTEADRAKFEDQITDGLTDGIFRGFENGKDFAENFFDSLRNTAKTTVLQPLVRFAVQPLGNLISGVLDAISGRAGALSSAGSLLGGAGGGTGPLGGLSQFASLGGGLASLGTFGGGLAAGFGGLTGSIGSLFGLAGTGTTLGGALSAGATAIGAGNLAGGIGTIVGALGPIALGIGALVSIMGDRNRWSGTFGEALVRDGQASDTSTRSTFTNSTYSADLSEATQRVGESIAATVEAFGGASTDFILRQFSATASKKDRAQAGTDLFIGGEFVSIGNTEVKKDEQAGEFANQTLRATLVVLQRTVRDRFGDYFRSINALEADLPDVQAVLDTAAAVQAAGQAVEQLGPTFARLNDLAVQTVADLAAEFGGFEGLGASAAAAFQALYTEEERLGFLTESLTATFGEFGVSVPQTREQFRTLLDGLDLTTEAGREAFAALTQAAPAWAQMTAAIDESARQAEERARAEQARALEAEISTLETGLQTLVETFGDVEGALAEMTAPAETLVDAWRRNTAEVERLESVLNGPGIAQGVESLIASFEGLGSAREDIAGRIFDLRTSRDPEGSVDLLRQREADLRAQLDVAPDKAAISAALTSTILERIQLEGQLEQRSLQAEADRVRALSEERLAGEIQLKEESLRSIEEQIKAMERVRTLTEGIGDLARSLTFSELSPLSPGAQLGALEAEYQRTLGQARGGDVDALGQVSSLAQQLLRQGQQYFGGTTEYAGAGGLFDRVRGDLEALGLSNLDRTDSLTDELEARQAELDLLTEQRDALRDNSQVLVDTTDRQIEALLGLDAALAELQESDRAQLEQVLEAQRALLDEQRAQIVQQAAIAEQQRDLLQRANDRLQQLVDRADAAALAPST